MSLSRAKFEALNSHHFQLCIDTVKSVLKDAGVKKEEIDEVEELIRLAGRPPVEGGGRPRPPRPPQDQNAQP